jgi:hypothetical protein
MFRVVFVGITIAAAAMGSAPTASAYPSICGPGTYQDAYGVCLPIPAYSGPLGGQDSQFLRLLTNPDQDYPMVIWNFPLVKAQGVQACQLQDQGADALTALHQLEAQGGYSFEAANSIVSSAMVVYCPWYLTPMPPAPVE